MAYPVIKTPRGTIAVGPNMTATLEWNPNFQPKRQKDFSAAQKHVDSEIIRLCEPYTPLRTGMLIKSNILGTEIGSGLVQWIAPYARPQYYGTRKPGSETGPLRGPKWFERMKQVHGQTIISGGKRIAGGNT